MRLIDADKTVEDLKKNCIDCNSYNGIKCRSCWVDDARLVLEDALTIDAAPVVHARWIYSGEMDEDGNCEANCSHCGAGDKHRADLKDAVPYCWKCGARMDGEADA